jgi:hypothetical protein
MERVELLSMRRADTTEKVLEQVTTRISGRTNSPRPAPFQRNDEVIADIQREGRTLTLPGVAQAALSPSEYENSVLVAFPCRQVPVRGRELEQRNARRIPDWEWLPAERVYRDPHVMGWCQRPGGMIERLSSG